MARLDELIAFCTVVEHKSFSKAARILNLSQPAVSFQIKTLETEYNSELLHRDGPEILMTESGQIVYQFAKQAIDLYEKSIQNVRHLNQDPLRGDLIIGSSTGPAEYLLPLLACHYKADFPDVKVKLNVASSTEVINLIQTYQIELGFVGAYLKDKNLQSEHFIRDKLILIISPDHPLASKRTISIEELRRIPLILQQNGSGATQSLEEALIPLGLNINDLNVVMELGLQESTKRAIKAGYGLTFISQLGVVDELKQGTFVEIKIDGEELYRDLHIVYRRSTPLSHLARSFSNFAKNKVSQILPSIVSQKQATDNFSC